MDLPATILETFPSIPLIDAYCRSKKQRWLVEPSRRVICEVCDNSMNWARQACNQHQNTWSSRLRSLVTVCFGVAAGLVTAWTRARGLRTVSVPKDAWFRVSSVCAWLAQYAPWKLIWPLTVRFAWSGALCTVRSEPRSNIQKGNLN